ncbi:hypothetical protein [Streptomyces tibetensis]|uniref:hypothetical protein n=1 Tax=Streptomyces tibetensis TaxID=2382123 RepID=UPI0033DC8F2B
MAPSRVPEPAARPEDCDEAPSRVPELTVRPEGCDMVPSWVPQLPPPLEESCVGR